MSRLMVGAVAALALSAMLPAATASAQVPENIYQGLLKIGQVVDPACTAKLYRSLMPVNDLTSGGEKPYPGITVKRDVSFGSNVKDVIDIFAADKGAGNRPVLIYVPGGGGNKTEQQVKEGNAFYDNIGRWATKNGMVAVLMQRHPGANWDDPPKDVSTLIQWVQANIKTYQGNPDRVFAWAQSAGNGPLGTYVGRPELYGPKGVGLKGAIYMSGQWNIAPLQPEPDAGPGGRGGPPAPGGEAPASPFPAPGSTCGAGGPGSGDGAIAGPSGQAPAAPRAGGPGGPGAGRGGGRGQVDPAVQLERSTLEGYKKVSTKLFFATAELDPGINGKMHNFYQMLHDELCKLGKDRCPTMLFEKRHSHMSEVFSIDTADTSVSGPILAWMKSVK